MTDLRACVDGDPFCRKLENHAVLSQEYGAAPVLEGDVPKHETKVSVWHDAFILFAHAEFCDRLRKERNTH
jgi:hypothetical protein